ncbi:DUF934 domain-containing protein [Parvularcula maris]|uniref:DUF934 domain-containing protein n=1 Tax=Parvularcula maris TaxID=2965077 RepID=A0A9X2LCY9_9PROT|nr:DUF934 domain-containing protein [Parvularcula maris]MCQ8186247.1 DUF934 domain-containing protein [Parvularcula maris]
MPTLFDLREGAVRQEGIEPSVSIPSGRDLVAEPLDLEGVTAIRLDMPGFKDGRAFSQARLLRQRFGFEGDLIVGGHVLPDQAQAMLRVGVNLVELADDVRVDAFAQGVKAYRYAYQRPAEGRPVFELRREER